MNRGLHTNAMRRRRAALIAACAGLLGWSAGCRHAGPLQSAPTEGNSPSIGQELPPAAPESVAEPEPAQVPQSVAVQDLDATEQQLLVEILVEQFDPCGQNRSFMAALEQGDCKPAVRLAAAVVGYLRDGQGKRQAVTSLLREIERINTVVSIDVSGAPRKGPAESKIQVVEFSDFECPFCRRAVGALDRLQKLYNFALYYRNFPLKLSHPHAEGAARAAWAADRQGKFWQMHDLLFENGHDLQWSSVKGYAKRVGLDLKKFAADVDSAAATAAVQADIAMGEAAGVDGTPTFFVNGRRAESLSQVQGLVRDAMADLGLPLPEALAEADLDEADPSGLAADAADPAAEPAAAPKPAAAVLGVPAVEDAP